MKERILQFLDSKRVTKYEFYKNTGISNGILSQKNGLSEENQMRLLSYYSEINPAWLLTGKGEMLHGAVAEPVAQYATKAAEPASNELTVYLKERVNKLEAQLQEKTRQVWELESKIEGLESELFRILEENARGQARANAG